ncbi:hypothetical protein ABPG72_012920 [Tetrahymena utriculariae]
MTKKQCVDQVGIDILELEYLSNQKQSKNQKKETLMTNMNNQTCQNQQTIILTDHIDSIKTQNRFQKSFYTISLIPSTSQINILRSMQEQNMVSENILRDQYYCQQKVVRDSSEDIENQIHKNQMVEEQNMNNIIMDAVLQEKLLENSPILPSLLSQRGSINSNLLQTPVSYNPAFFNKSSQVQIDNQSPNLNQPTENPFPSHIQINQKP